MNSNDFTLLLQKGFRITLGAATTLVETLQDPLQRERSLTNLSSKLGQLSEEWAEKGAVTEQEAREFVSRTWGQAEPRSSTVTVDVPATVPPSSTTAPATVQADLQELTAQITAIREEVERLRNKESSS